jgi:hypothetical protein
VFEKNRLIPLHSQRYSKCLPRGFISIQAVKRAHKYCYLFRIATASFWWSSAESIPSSIWSVSVQITADYLIEWGRLLMGLWVHWLLRRPSRRTEHEHKNRRSWRGPIGRKPADIAAGPPQRAWPQDYPSLRMNTLKHLLNFAPHCRVCLRRVCPSTEPLCHSRLSFAQYSRLISCAVLISNEKRFVNTWTFYIQHIFESGVNGSYDRLCIGETTHITAQSIPEANYLWLVSHTGCKPLVC